MQIQNIHNSKRAVHLFERLDSGDLVISTDYNFYPYYYEQDDNGTYNTYDGKKARMIVANEPKDVARFRTENSYESDVVYVCRYIIDKIPKFDKTPIKYMMFDIECLTPEMPDPDEAKYPISCITTYTSIVDEYKQWYLGDWMKKFNNIKVAEKWMLDDFVEYIIKETPDLMTAWYVDGFDYPYLTNRIKDFPKRISPINQCRYPRKTKVDYEEAKRVLHPAGLSIVDYLTFYKIIFKGIKDYRLDTVLEHEFGKGKKHKKVDFGKLSPIIPERNMEDVVGLVNIEKKLKLIDHYDEIRRFARVEWEDLGMNSRGVDLALFKEAKKQKLLLPRKRSGDESEEFEGAFRESFDTGIFFNEGKYDLSGAYLYTITDLCLDSSNIKDKMEKDTLPVHITDRVTKKRVATYYIKQNSNALLPTIVRDITEKKNTFKKLRDDTPQNDPLYEEKCKKYDAIKSFALSYWGVIGNKHFRLYDSRVAGMITSVVRDLLYYIMDELEKRDYKVRYIDTDSVFVKDNGKNITPLLNKLIDEWSNDRFGKELSIVFDYEGRFTKVMLLSKCHYYGYIEGRKKPEIKGVEVKRTSSSVYEAYFQETLINKLLDGQIRDQVVEWIKLEKERIKTLSIFEIAFPCKIAGPYNKTVPIFVRGANNSKKILKDFDVTKGESFFYLPIEPMGIDENGKPIDVIGIKDDTILPKAIKVNWNEVMKRNIMNKARKIFDACDLGNIEMLLSNQIRFF